MGDIKPIETIYNGYRFRSRLEARWAVFFDALGIKYEYEKEGYELESGRYLPDFWVSDLEYHIEIKPSFDAITDLDVERWQEFAPMGLHILVGSPVLPKIHMDEDGSQVAKIDGPMAITYFKKTIQGERPDGVYADFRPWVWQERLTDGTVLLWPAFAFEPILSPEIEQICMERKALVFVMPNKKGGTINFAVNPGATKAHDTPRLIEAYNSARQARFEHGETPRFAGVGAR